MAWWCWIFLFCISPFLIKPSLSLSPDPRTRNTTPGFLPTECMRHAYDDREQPLADNAGSEKRDRSWNGFEGNMTAALCWNAKREPHPEWLTVRWCVCRTKPHARTGMKQFKSSQSCSKSRRWYRQNNTKGASEHASFCASYLQHSIRRQNINNNSVWLAVQLRVCRTKLRTWTWHQTTRHGTKPWPLKGIGRWAFLR